MVGFDTEFVLAVPHVLDERMTAAQARWTTRGHRPLGAGVRRSSLLYEPDIGSTDHASSLHDLAQPP